MKFSVSAESVDFAAVAGSPALLADVFAAGAATDSAFLPTLVALFSAASSLLGPFLVDSFLDDSVAAESFAVEALPVEFSEADCSRAGVPASAEKLVPHTVSAGAIAIVFEVETLEIGSVPEVGNANS